MINPDFQAFLVKQNGIYDNMAATSDTIGDTVGVERDPGTEPQSAFLVAWRHPEHITDGVEELSFAVNSLHRAFIFTAGNAHSTLSDHDLQRDRIITPESPDHNATLVALSRAVRNGLDAVSKDTIDGRGVTFGKAVSNGKTVVSLGQPSEDLWRINQAVKQASASEEINDGAGLKGTWGSHMTVNRFLANYSPEDSRQLANVLHRTPDLGHSKPTAIDVGYFHADPDNGFTYTTHERFDLN